MNAFDVLKQRQIDVKESELLEKKREQKRQEKAKMRRFFDDEAELGSDNEVNDECKAKRIDMDDEEENEEGLDAELEGFVDREPLQGDAEEIEAGNEAAHDAF